MSIQRVAVRPFPTINTIDHTLRFPSPHHLTTFDPTDTRLQTNLHQNVFHQPTRPGRFPRHWRQCSPSQGPRGRTQGPRRVAPRECKYIVFAAPDLRVLTWHCRSTPRATTLHARLTPLMTATTQSCPRRCRRLFPSQSRRVKTPNLCQDDGLLTPPKLCPTRSTTLARNRC